jgi:hypothetical protein
MRGGSSFDRFRKQRPDRSKVIGGIVVGFLLATLYVNYSVLFDRKQYSQLIFDIGFSPDTIEYYLAAEHKVIGINANPLIVIAAQELFQSQVSKTLDFLNLDNSKQAYSHQRWD